MPEDADPNIPNQGEEFGTPLASRHKIIQPTAAILQETQNVPTSPSVARHREPLESKMPVQSAATNPPAPANPYDLRQQSAQTGVYPTASKGINAVNPTMPTPPAPDQGRDNTFKQKISARAPSLKLYAIVMLILDGLGLIGALLALSAITAEYNTLNKLTSGQALDYIFREIISYGILLLPFISSIIFLVSKSLVLVKALLIVVLINYAVGLASLIVSFIALHATFGTEIIISLAISIMFAVWTYSVFSEVSALQDV